MMNRLLIAAVGFASLINAQLFTPESAHVFLYFPHLVDGGPQMQRWQTTLTFVNRNESSAAGMITFYGDSGAPLMMDFGGGPASQFSFTIPANGSRVFRSRMLSSTSVTGWATAVASLPIQGVVSFRAIQNGVPFVELASNPTLPTPIFSSSATASLGIALANAASSLLSVEVIAYSSEGALVGQGTVIVPARGHTSFNLASRIPGLRSDFAGSVVLRSADPAKFFLAWTVAADGGTVSTLPDGRADSPVSQGERIWKVYMRVLDVTQRYFGLGAPPTLVLDSSPVINAFAGNNTVRIHLALAELLGDSEGELAFIIGHELGHIYQQRTGSALFPQNLEYDADVFGAFAALIAGYDAYGAAGALAKLAMATGTAGLTTQFEAQLAADAHKSFNSRLELIFGIFELVCSMPDARTYCDLYKSIVHPHLPIGVPLGANPVDQSPKLPELK